MKEGWGKGSGTRGYKNEVGGSGEYRTKRLTITLSDEEYEVVKSAIEGDGRSISEIGRTVLLEWATGKVRRP